MKRFFVFFIIAVALMAVLALSVCAEIISDDIYVSTTDSSSAASSSVAYYKDEVKADFSEDCDKTGLCYTFDKSTGTLTIDYASGFNSENVNNKWVVPAIDDVTVSTGIKHIIINADIKEISTKYALNSLKNLQDIVIPASLNKLGNQSMARLLNLKSVKVAGVDEEYYSVFSDYDRVFDFRYIADVESNSFQDLCSNAKTSTTDPKTLTNVAVLLGDESADGKTIYTCDAKNFGPHSKVEKTDGVTVPDDNCLTFTFFVPDSIENPEETKFFTNINKYVSGSVSYCNYYKHEIKRYPKALTYNYALSHVGFQIRTKDYNGLRGVFSFDSTAANDGYTLKEFGTVAIPLTGNKPVDGVNYRITYDSGNNKYIADDPSCKAHIVPMWKDGTGKNAAKLSEFYISIVN